MIRGKHYGESDRSFINRAGRYDKYCGKVLDHKSDIHIFA